MHGRTPGNSLIGLLGTALALSFAAPADAAPGDVTVSRVADIHPGGQSSNPNDLFDSGGTLLFSAGDGVNGTELWKSNGGPLGPGGTEMAVNLESGSGGSTPREFTKIGSTV